MCFGAAVSSVLLLDDRRSPLTPAAIWADTRASAQAGRLSDDPGPALTERTGCPIHATYLPAKLMWWRETNSEILDRAERILSLKEYVIEQLCGANVVDHSTACASGLLNINSLTWDDMALAPAGIQAGRLSELVPTTHILSLKPDAARKMGVRSDLPVVIGATDGALSNLGAGAVTPGQVVTMVGSSGAVRMTTDKPRVDPQGRTWCYPLIAGNRWVSGGANNSGGLVLDWVANDLLGLPANIKANELAKRAVQSPPGADGLVFLPTIMGERSPIWNESARGVLFGLSDQHGPEHVLRATLEGIVYSLHSVYRVLAAEGDSKAREIRATGGYANSLDWVEIQASVFGQTISIPAQTEGSSLGAAILGWVVLGRLHNIDEGERFVSIEAEVEPDEAHRETYDLALEIHEALYTRLVDLLV
jgi:gluconokinase